MFTRRQALQGLCAAGWAAAAPVAHSAPAPAPNRCGDSVTVLSYNLWNGGRHGGVEQTANVIRACQADVVGLQETEASGQQLAELTGLSLFEQGEESRGAVLTRFPIVAASANKWGVKLDVPDFGMFWLFNAHLPSAPYQPYQLAGIPYGEENPFIETAAEAIAEALRARSEPVARLLMDMAPAIRANEPILLTGDFNEPSHLDWTERAARAGLCPLPVVWPTSRLINDAGLTDVYRFVHRDELARPGHTWTPHKNENEREIHDRIDFVYSRGLRPVSATIIGESPEHADLVVSPYPSDHRAVTATLTVA